MENTLENTAHTQAKLQKLLDDKLYIGDLGTKGFIFKRNFGARRMPVYGILNENHFEVKAKNETIHDYFMWVAIILMLGILLFAAYHKIYFVVVANSIFILLMFMMDRHRKKKEMEQFFKAFEEASVDK